MHVRTKLNVGVIEKERTSGNATDNFVNHQFSFIQKLYVFSTSPLNLAKGRIVLSWSNCCTLRLICFRNTEQGTNKRKQFQQLRVPSSRWILFISFRLTHFMYPDLAKNQQESKIRLLKENWRRMKFARNLFYQNSISSMNFSVDVRWRRALEQMLSQMENTWNMQSGNFASCRQFLKAIGTHKPWPT